MAALQLVVFSGLPGTGKSELAEAVGRALGIPVFAKDWMEATVKEFGRTHDARAGEIGYGLLTTLAGRQLRLGQSAILDSVASTASIRQTWRALAAEHGAALRVIECLCSDENVHRARLAERRRNIPGWPELEWAEVERVRGYYAPWGDAPRLVVDMLKPVEENVAAVLNYLKG
jgi:predicted kinase